MANQTDEAQVSAFLGNPTEATLRDMSAHAFHQCVAQVFARAGYETKGHLLDVISSVHLDLYTSDGGRRLVGAVSVHYADASRPLTARDVRTLQRNSGIRTRNVSGYLVTNGGADHSAYEQARSGSRVFLLTGDQFCRYARYVGASRFQDGTGLTVVIPPDEFSGEPESSHGSRANILVFANNKGGVGKTTSTRQFAVHMGETGLQVLLVDMDPQHNLTEDLSHKHDRDLARPSKESANLAEYFAGNRNLAELVRPTDVEGTTIPNVYLIPSHSGLSLLDTGGAGRPAVEMGFARDLYALAFTPNQATSKPFDWIIIDTPPAVSLFTRAALCAADYVIAPARSRPSSVTGTKNMVNTLDTMNALKRAPATLLGCLLTHWQDDEHSIETFAYLEDLFGGQRSRIMASYIPFDVTIEKTRGATQHRAHNAYAAATQEVLNYVQRQ